MFVFSIFNCFNYLLFGYCSCFCFGFGSVFGFVFGFGCFAVRRHWAPKDLGNELGRAYNLYAGSNSWRKQSLQLRHLMLLPLLLQSINQSIIVKAAANVPQHAPPLSLCLRSCPSFIRMFQLTFKRCVFPLRDRQSDPAPVPGPRSGTAFIDGTIRSIFAPLYNNYILSASTVLQLRELRAQ